jgi:TolB-like protein
MHYNHHISLIVLPFEDLSPEKNQGIFCRSFSDDLITELSRFRQLRVIIIPPELHADDLPIVSETLNHGYLVKGTFRSEGKVLRINVQLYDNDSRNLVWGHRFEGNLAELEDIKENLLKNVVAILQQQIDHDLLIRFRQGQKVVFSAYEHCLYGMEELKKGSVEADLKAREHFEKALEIQPDYGLACTGMSLSYFNEWTCQLWDRWEISKSGAYEWARRAIELDDQNHVVAMVLGRIYLYEGSYSTSEYYFRRSLMLNSNDPDTLFNIAVYFVFFGYEKEALELYEKGLQLNPLFNGNHFRLGGCIYFEMGDYEKAEQYIKAGDIGKARIADTDAYCAAIYYYLGKFDKMRIYWKAYLDAYRRLIARGNDFTEQEAIIWILKLNPHRYKSNLEEFLKYISNGLFDKYPVQSKIPAEANIMEAYFLKETTAWKFSFDGTSVQVPEIKGYLDIQKMLMQPNQVFHCAELMGSTINDHGEKLIDEKARKQYQKKILELQNELEEAEQLSNFEKAEKLQEEYDQLIEYLSQSLNLKGQIRETGGTVEKARSAVTWRIRSAIARIEQTHPSMGAHLSNAVKTGTLCSYKPDRNINWITS